MNETYNVVFADLPCTIRGFVRYNQEDDSNTIVLNSRLNRETQIECMKHELKHIERDDFYSEKSVDQIELEVRGK